MSKARFGEQRLALPDVSGAERLLFHAMRVADPAHYLHSRYFLRALAVWEDLAPRAILDAGCGRGDYSFYLPPRNEKMFRTLAQTECRSVFTSRASARVLLGAMRA